MSKALQIIQAKPNPLGKDKTGSGQSKPEQLLGEWVDVKNIGTESISFSSMTLNHTLFDSRCQSTNRTENYWSGGPEQLLPGQVIRVHTGKISDKHLMAEADRAGVDWHGYANRDNFVKGLKATLLTSRPTVIDGYSALEFTAETADKIFKSRVLLVGRRPYQIVIGSPKGIDDSVSVNRFFNSFKVGKP